MNPFVINDLHGESNYKGKKYFPFIKLLRFYSVFYQSATGFICMIITRNAFRRIVILSRNLLSCKLSGKPLFMIRNLHPLKIG